MSVSYQQRSMETIEIVPLHLFGVGSHNDGYWAVSGLRTLTGLALCLLISMNI